MLQRRREFLIVILASTLTLAPKSALGSVFGTLERLREVDDALLHAGKSLDDLYNLIERAIEMTSSVTTPTSLEPTESSWETSSSLLTSTVTPSFSTHLSETTSTSLQPTESSQETISSLLTSAATPSSFSTLKTSTNGPSIPLSTHLPTSDSSTSQHSVSDSPTPSGVSSTPQSQTTSPSQLPVDRNSLLPMAYFIREILGTKKDARIEALASISSSYQMSPRSLFKTTLWNTLNFDNIQQRSSFLKHMMGNAVRNLNPLLDGTESSDSRFAILGNKNSFQRKKELFYNKMIRVSGKEGLSPALTNSDMAEVGNQTNSTFRELLSSIKDSLTTGLNSQFPLPPKDQFIILKKLLSTWKIMQKEKYANNSRETITISPSVETNQTITSTETTKITTPDETTQTTTSAETTQTATSTETTKISTSDETTQISDETTEISTSDEKTQISGETTEISTSDETTQISDETTEISTSKETTAISTPSPTVITRSTTQATVSTTPKTPASWRNETTAVVQAMLQVMLQIEEGNADHTHAFELEQSASLLDDLVLEGEEFELAGQLNVSSEDLDRVASVKKVAQASEEAIKEMIDEAEKDEQELVITIVMLSLLFVVVLVAMIIAFIRPRASRFRFPKSNGRSRRSASPTGDPNQFENARYQDHGQAMSLGEVHTRPE